MFRQVVVLKSVNSQYTDFKATSYHEIMARFQELSSLADDVLIVRFRHDDYPEDRRQDFIEPTSPADEVTLQGIILYLISKKGTTGILTTKVISSFILHSSLWCLKNDFQKV